MENILPFFIIGLVYVGINPSASCAVFYFRFFAIARILHTLVYAVVVVPQPARALCYFGGVFVNMSMVLSILSTYSYAM